MNDSTGIQTSINDLTVIRRMKMWRDDEPLEDLPRKISIHELSPEVQSSVSRLVNMTVILARETSDSYRTAVNMALGICGISCYHPHPSWQGRFSRDGVVAHDHYFCPACMEEYQTLIESSSPLPVGSILPEAEPVAA